MGKIIEDLSLLLIWFSLYTLNFHHSWSNFNTFSLLFSRSSLYTLNFHLSRSNFYTISLLFSCSSLCALNIPLLISFCFHPGP
ncbi:unnamed protein product [Merluccius merluccius]